MGRLKEADTVLHQGIGNVVSLYNSSVPARVGEYAPNAIERRIVQKLRALLLSSLLKPRGDFEKACFLIAADANITTERYAAAFFHGLEIFGIRKFEFYNLGSASVSLDEMWAVRLLLSLLAEDYSTVRYLMSVRIEPAGQRRLGFLAQQLASSVSKCLDS